MPRKKKFDMVPAVVPNAMAQEIQTKVAAAIKRAGLKTGLTGEDQNTDLVDLLAVMAADESLRPVDRIAAAKCLMSVMIPQAAPITQVAVAPSVEIKFVD